ncbi:unnamed protein product [Polarella glacialis]|uniref:Endonuclease/exonuclease/phosphatase domain-containing protein n=2 Tax=Polarella glacialis TaxID=89957 RepID=A0A813EQM1_POLGL|nr:unnamed protein product [Polarella glacialis]
MRALRHPASAALGGSGHSWRLFASQASLLHTTCAQKRRTPPGPRDFAAGLGLAAALAAYCASADGPARCDGPAPADIKLVTYNVLSPKLAPPNHFPKCAPEDLDKANRLPKILARLREDVADGRIIALQEVDLEWAGQLHVFFAEQDYAVVFAQYGNQHSGYMGVMLAWPRTAFEALEVDISKLADTAPKGVWPKAERSTLNRFGMFTYQGMKEVLGCSPPDFNDRSDGEWRLAQSRANEAIFVRLRQRAAPLSRSFVVGTYHMPCLFGTTEKVRAVNITSQLLLGRLSSFAAGDPVALMGDFNMKPATSSYQLFSNGGSLPGVTQGLSASDVTDGSLLPEVRGLDRLPGVPLPGGLDSAYNKFYGKEPLFTNFAVSSFNPAPFVETLDYIWFSRGQFSVVACQQLPTSKEEVNGPFPNKTEPSDHLPLHATLRMG